MGGKRPDQYNIDPGETLATDYKTIDEDRGVRQQDIQEVSLTEKKDREHGSFIPHGGKNPALEALQHKREELRAQKAHEQGDDA